MFFTMKIKSLCQQLDDGRATNMLGRQLSRKSMTLLLVMKDDDLGLPTDEELIDLVEKIVCCKGASTLFVEDNVTCRQEKGNNFSL